MKLPLLFVPFLGLSLVSNAQQRPNIIVINADDLGYGDVSCNGMTQTSTPNIDRIATEGLRFTNMHTTSATSTPSRFSLLTGAYAWRTPGTGVAPGDAAMIITPEMKTLPAMLQRGGYITAAIGKWHLGIGAERGKQDWNNEISPALKDIGFDYSYIMAATGDRVPCVFIEQGKIVGLEANDPIAVSYSTPFDGEPTGKDNPELLKLHPSHGHDQTIVNGISRIGYMKGGKSALWVDENIADSITAHALQFIDKNYKKPFFLYFATNDIHVPRAPHQRFVGKSGMGARGDAILELDWSVGEILKKLDELGIAGNTILIFTSDNGPVVDDGYKDQAIELLGNHCPSSWMRGGKYSIFEAGTRVPCVIRWKDKIPENKTSDAVVCNVDLFATLAAFAEINLEENEAPDSQNLHDVFLGKDKKGRKWLVEDAYSRSITKGNWKYIKPSKQAKIAWQTGIETGCNEMEQLYNIKKDPAETNNQAQKHPRKVEKLKRMLEQIEKQK